MRPKVALPFIALAGLLLTTGGLCGSLTPAEPTPTNTPLPPPPTATREPTDVPTATVDRAATAQAQLEEQVRAALEEADLPSDTGYVGWVQTEPIDIELSGPGGFYNSFAEDLVVSDFVIRVDITWNTTAWPWCGLFFRADPSYGDGDYYAIWFLRFSGLPAYDIDYYRDGEMITQISQDYRFSDTLDINSGAINQIMLAAQGNQFKVYVNGHYEGVYYDYSSYLTEGRFAYVAYEDSGSTTCTFENAWIWVYK
jgi:hypothetical protein